MINFTCKNRQINELQSSTPVRLYGYIFHKYNFPSIFKFFENHLKKKLCQNDKPNLGISWDFSSTHSFFRIKNFPEMKSKQKNENVLGIYAITCVSKYFYQFDDHWHHHNILDFLQKSIDGIPCENSRLSTHSHAFYSNFSKSITFKSTVKCTRNRCFIIKNISEGISKKNCVFINESISIFILVFVSMVSPI